MTLKEKLAEANQLREEMEAPYRANVSPKVLELRGMIRHLPTSGLIMYLCRPSEMEVLHDLSHEQLGAVMLAVADEIDCRIPRLVVPAPYADCNSSADNVGSK